MAGISEFRICMQVKKKKERKNYLNLNQANGISKEWKLFLIPWRVNYTELLKKLSA